MWHQDDANHWTLLLCYVYDITGPLLKKGFCTWSLLTRRAFFRQMPPGRSLKEQWLKFVRLEYFHVFGLPQGMKTSSSWQHSMSENQVPLGTVSAQDEKANCHSSIACCCPRPLCSSQYLWPGARAPYLVSLPLVSLTPQYLLHTDGSCASSQCQEPSRHSSLTGFLHLF